jgi:NAD(P)H-hydrate epimerase
MGLGSMKIVTAEQMRNIDRRATDRFAVPSIILMENAAAAVVDAIFDHYAGAERIALFCGTGQNGGDGFAVARHLENRGVVPLVFVVGDRSRCSGDAATNLTICERLSLPMYDIRDTDSLEDAIVHAGDADLVVDAIFGTGLNRAAEGFHAETIRAINELGLPIVAIDVPSGMDASSPEVLDPAIRAALTVTFAAPKICHVFEPAAVHCGEIVVADISIPNVAIDDENVTLSLTTPAVVRPHLSPRLAMAH